MKATYPKKFKWSGPHDGCGRPRWCCDHPDLSGLDVTELAAGADGSSRVSVSTRSEELEAVCCGLHGVGFASKDEAASVVLALVRAHRAAVAKAPVPAEQINFVLRQLDNNRTQEKALRDMCWANRSQLRQLRATAKALGLEQRMPSYDVSDTAKLIAEIDSFKLDFDGPDDPPFFSEGKLYDLLGKEQARSVLALMHQIKQTLDPIAGSE